MILKMLWSPKTEQGQLQSIQIYRSSDYDAKWMTRCEGHFPGGTEYWAWWKGLGPVAGQEPPKHFEIQDKASLRGWQEQLCDQEKNKTTKSNPKIVLQWCSWDELMLVGRGTRQVKPAALKNGAGKHSSVRKEKVKIESLFSGLNVGVSTVSGDWDWAAGRRIFPLRVASGKLTTFQGKTTHPIAFGPSKLILKE